MTALARQNVPFDELRTLLTAACRAVGGNEATATSLTEATLSAHQFGPDALGLPHFVDYLDALEAGRINGNAAPAIAQPLPAILSMDAHGGIAQTGFDLVFPKLKETARALGVVLFTQSNSYTSGELGYYVRRLAAEGLIAMAATNGPPLMAAQPGGQRVYCTNPFAFAAPGGPDGGQIIVDQSSSAVAFVKLIMAAAAGKEIPQGWAIDAHGAPTTDAACAVEGALLPFGGARGANIALMVELLAAGVSGANWSLDAPDFQTGDRSPGIGLTIIAFAPPPEFAERVAKHMRRLESLGVHVPGKRSASTPARNSQPIPVDETAFLKIAAFAARLSRAAHHNGAPDNEHR
jgi:(2R)-3-sulfolactate dehydrogenase (NADP+)